MLKTQKYLFIDRDGTLIAEPTDQQVDSINKLEFLPGVFSALATLKQAGYELVMVTNQDGLGTASFPQADFEAAHMLMLKTFASQGITFSEILVCPHVPQDECACRKPKIGMLLPYLKEQKLDRKNSFVIGDRVTDLQLAENLGICGIQMGGDGAQDWAAITRLILQRPRRAEVKRHTNETQIFVAVDLDNGENIQVQTGNGFFDHMLEQLIKHAGISAMIQVRGDLHIDDHHTVEDTALALGEALRQALGEKRGIARYGFLLPMDEALATVALDLSGRAHCEFSAKFTREKVGALATEMVAHFFRSLASGMQATLHLRVEGENTHHQVEALFKGVGRALRQALTRIDDQLPSTKGIL